MVDSGMEGLKVQVSFTTLFGVKFGLGFSVKLGISGWIGRRLRRGRLGSWSGRVFVIFC